MRSILLILALLGFAGAIIWTDQPMRMEARGPEVAMPVENSAGSLPTGATGAITTSTGTTYVWTSSATSGMTTICSTSGPSTITLARSF